MLAFRSLLRDFVSLYQSSALAITAPRAAILFHLLNPTLTLDQQHPLVLLYRVGRLVNRTRTNIAALFAVTIRATGPESGIDCRTRPHWTVWL